MPPSRRSRLNRSERPRWASPRLACAVAVFGHNPDTSYARIEIERNRIETKLTYDIFTLLRIAPLDENGDGQVSKAELTRQLPRIAAFLDDRIDLVVNEEVENATLGRLDGSAGLIKTTRDGIKTTLERYSTRIDRQQLMLETRRQELMRQYTAADQAIAQLNSVMSSINNLQRSF